jgi:hypothetical protein
VGDTWTGARLTDVERIEILNNGSIFLSARWRWGADQSVVFAVLAPGARVTLVAPHPQVYLEFFGGGGQAWINGSRSENADRH